MTDNKIRDQLRDTADKALAVLFLNWDLTTGLPDPSVVAVHLIDALTARGWRPPVRVISDPAELDALPVESVVIDADGDAWQRYFTYWWLAGADTRRDSQGLVDLCKQLTVVHVPPARKESTDGQ